MTALRPPAPFTAAPTAPRRLDRWARALIPAALLLSLGHHRDHVVRGDHVGWPLTPEVTPFTYSLGIYPLLLLGLLLARRGRVGPGYWALLSGPGAVFVAAVHLGPAAVEHPHEIAGAYAHPAWGWLAVAELLLFLGVLVTAFVVELLLWQRKRARRSAGRVGA